MYVTCSSEKTPLEITFMHSRMYCYCLRQRFRLGPSSWNVWLTLISEQFQSRTERHPGMQSTSHRNAAQGVYLQNTAAFPGPVFLIAATCRCAGIVVGGFWNFILGSADAARNKVLYSHVNCISLLKLDL